MVNKSAGHFNTKHRRSPAGGAAAARRMLRTFAATLVLAWLWLAVPGPAAADTLRILHTNDMHSHLIAHRTARGDTLGGMARLSTLIDAERAAVPAAILVDGGDMFQGSSIYSFFKGEAEFRVMSAMGYDAMAMGNHELDDGPQNLLQQHEQWANFPILTANVLVRRWMATRAANPERTAGGRSVSALADSLAELADTTLVPVGLPYAVVRSGPFQVGLIGVSTETLPQIVAPTRMDGVVVRPVITTVRKVLPGLRRQADVIVVLSHCGLADDSLLAATVPGIDVIVSAHDHQTLNEPRLVKNAADTNGIGGALLVETGQWGEHLGELDLDLKDGRIQHWQGRLIPVTPDIQPSTRIVPIVAEYYDKVAPLVSRVVAFARAPFPDDSVMVAETPLGNLIADIMRETAGTDLAVENGGGIRSHLDFGAIKVGDVYSVLPFDNTIILMVMTGAQVEEMCRQMVARRGGGGFGQVSALAFDIKGGLPVNIRVGGLPLDPRKTYAVATNSFTAGGGDGFTVFNGIKQVDSGVTLRDAFLKGLQRRKAVYPRVEGRIRFLD